MVLAWLGTGLVICALSLACGPSAPPTPTPNPDAFAVVRATSQAAFQAGQAELSHGDYLQACVDLDRARTNDPDSRVEIQQALDQALTHCLTPVAQATSAPAAASQRTLVVATIARGCEYGAGWHASGSGHGQLAIDRCDAASWRQRTSPHGSQPRMPRSAALRVDTAHKRLRAR